jgi:hypothetical protein
VLAFACVGLPSLAAAGSFQTAGVLSNFNGDTTCSVSSVPTILPANISASCTYQIPNLALDPDLLVRHQGGALVDWGNIGVFSSSEWESVADLSLPLPVTNETSSTGRSHYESSFLPTLIPYYTIVSQLAMSGRLTTNAPSPVFTAFGGATLTAFNGSCNVGASFSDIAADGIVSLTCPQPIISTVFLSPVARTPFTIDLFAVASVGMRYNFLDASVDRHYLTTANFFHTFTLSSVLVFDPDGNPIDIGTLGLDEVNGMRLTSTGFQPVGATSEVPEPSTIWLAAAGCVAWFGGPRMLARATVRTR